MTEGSNTLIGHIIDVQGGSLTAALTEDEQGHAPTVTIGDEDILVGQIGSYVAVIQGTVKILALITRMTEQEKLAPLGAGESGIDTIRLSFAQRTVSLVPIGSLNAGGEFERGVATFPTTGAEIHVVGAEDINKMFSKYQSKGFEVGTLSSHPAFGVCLDPSSLFGRHFTILGQTGAGKSWTVATLVQQAVKIMPRAHILILDLHGEYCWTDKGGTSCSTFGNAMVRYVDARELEIPYWLMTFAELCDLLIDRGEFSAHNQLAVFRDAVNYLKLQEGKKLDLDRTTLDTPIFFDLIKLRSMIEEKNGLVKSPSTGNPIKGPLTGAFDNFLMRLDSRLGDVKYDFLLKPKIRTNSATLAALLRDFVGLGDPKRPVTVLDLSTVPFDVRPTVAAQIGRLAFEFNYWNPEYREFPILLICEEAHAYIPREKESQYAGSRKSMERIAKEGRKYGVGLGVVSQRPHEVSETVLSQCGTFLCLRITNPDDQSYVRSLVPEAERDLVDILAGLGRGEAMALGEAVPLPTRLRFYKPNPAPNSDDIDFYTKWKTGPEDINVDEIVRRWRRQER
jgi:DNA helicase HerA-like ATPase